MWCNNALSFLKAGGIVSGTPSDLHEPLSPIALLHPVGKESEKRLIASVCLARWRKGIRERKRKHIRPILFSADLHNARGVPRFLARHGHYEQAKQIKSISIIPLDRKLCRPVGLIHSVSLYYIMQAHRHLHPPNVVHWTLYANCVALSRACFARENWIHVCPSSPVFARTSRDKLHSLLALSLIYLLEGYSRQVEIRKSGSFY